MTSAVFAEGSHGRDNFRVGLTYDERQVALAVLDGPLMLTLVLVPGYCRCIAIFILPRKVDEVIEACGSGPTWVVTAQVVK